MALYYRFQTIFQQTRNRVITGDLSPRLYDKFVTTLILCRRRRPQCVRAKLYAELVDERVERLQGYIKSIHEMYIG